MSLPGPRGDTVADLSGSVPAGVYSDIEAYYSAKVARYGATPMGVDWSCQATQSLRFVQLLKVCDFSTAFSLNDIGCGYGALAAFLAVRHPKAKVDYLGIDLSRPMIERARRRHSGPDRRFTTRTTGFRIADYSVASGIMNVSLGHSHEIWEGFVARTLAQMRATSRLGFSVNFFSDMTRPGTPASPAVDDLYRTRPEKWASYCEDELDCAVETVTDYGMKEFTLLVRCNRSAKASSTKASGAKASGVKASGTKASSAKASIAKS
jgi:SAM-dependent methyltransferase